MEVRRRFLVMEHLLPTSMPPAQLIVHGYLSSEPETHVRVSGETGWLLVHIDDNKLCYPIPWPEAELILNKTLWRYMKNRYELQVNGKTWCIDEFIGKHEGLWTAEVEIAKNEGYEPPEWLGPDVTWDKRYFGINLARTQRPPFTPL